MSAHGSPMAEMSERFFYGNISGMAIASEQKGYFVGYTSWDESTLYGFHPGTGEVYSPIDGFANKHISGLESRISMDYLGRLWIGNRTDSRVDLLDPETDSVVAFIATGLSPLKVVFCAYER